MLKHITLTLARNPGYPAGNAACGYDIIAPLDDSGHLDIEAWHKMKGQCRVKRFWEGERDRPGRLIHHAGGASGATWKIGYDDDTSAAEEAGYRLDTHRFAKNEYISIRDSDGHSHTFKIDAVNPA